MLVLLDSSYNKFTLKGSATDKYKKCVKFL